MLILTGRRTRAFEAPWHGAGRGRRAVAGLLTAFSAVFAPGLA
ncbi:hypothetical protein [Streptomyces sp. MUM 178J]|nr:hypothetical protein [Streptomyces sp. MUM 178J]WRQ79261.1 hypothetical protein I3F59_007695 [Streptomyces sp. MUM 178J]